MRDNFLFLVADVSRVQKGRWCRLALRPVLDLELTRLVLLCASHFSKIQIQIQIQILTNTVILNHNQSQHNSDHFFYLELTRLVLLCAFYILGSKAISNTQRNTNTKKILVSTLELTKLVLLCFKLL